MKDRRSGRKHITYSGEKIRGPLWGVLCRVLIGEVATHAGRKAEMKGSTAKWMSGGSIGRIQL